MELIIEKIVYPGKSMARLGGKVIFTDEGLPGETIEVDVIKDTKSYTECRTIKVITPSLRRQEPQCSHYKACSPYQYIDYQYQIDIKKAQLAEIMARQLRIDLPEPIFRPGQNIWGYRNKIKLKITTLDKKPALVYNLPRSFDRFIPAGHCLLSPKLTNLFLSAFSEFIAVNPTDSLNELIVRENSKNELLIVIYHSASLNMEHASRIFQGFSKKFPISGFILVNQGTIDKVVLWGEDFFKETILGRDFFIGAESFFQVNTGMLSVLIEDLRNNLRLGDEKTIADLYCGIGTFGTCLSSQVKRVIGIEVAAENFFFMEKNIKLNNIKNFTPVLSGCEKAIDTLFKQKIDAAIIDPPRKGMDKKVCAALARSGPPLLAYISCDPATLTRDLKTLLSSYEIKKICGYDFFPQTPHMESMVLLEKR